MKVELNDKELISLFKRCIGGSADSCRNCPYKTSYTHCKIEKLHTDVLKLAIRLYCENGKLKTELRDECEEHKAFTKKAKKEIERLTEDRNQLALCNKGLQDGINEYQADNAELGRKNAELQKQVDELKDERENMQAEILRFEDMKFTQEHCDLYDENEALKQWLKRLNADLEYEKNWGKIQTKQAEKDTAKYILGLILAKEFEKGDYLTDDELKELFKERYGVEVE